MAMSLSMLVRVTMCHDVCLKRDLEMMRVKGDGVKGDQGGRGSTCSWGVWRGGVYIELKCDSEFIAS